MARPAVTGGRLALEIGRGSNEYPESLGSVPLEKTFHLPSELSCGSDH